MSKKDYTNWDRNELIKEIEQLRKRKKYGLVWEDKPENVVEQCKTELPVLEEVKSKEIITDPDKPVNLLIEGDNYHALSVLNYTHKGKIDVIYIDPPYNTGNKDFTYNDNIIDKEDPYRHTKWVSFIHSRLKLAHKLLKNSGVVFISIDDNEQAQLRLVCDEIFGEKNFIEALIWKKRTTPPNDRAIGRIHEYIHVYAKSPEYYLDILPRGGKSIARYKNPDNDPRGSWVSSDLSANGKGGRLVKSCIYPIKNPKNNKEYLPSDGRCWLFNKEKMQKWIEEGRVSFREKSGAPFLKRYLTEVRQGVTLPTILLEQGFSSNSSAELEKIFGGKGFFEYPKPTSLIKDLIQISTKSDSVILDFMAGSGTTGHAVLELNKKDNRNRKFILCTNNENEIAEEVCYPRIEKVINGYKFSGQEKSIVFEQKLSEKVLSDIDIVLYDLEKAKENNKSNYDKLEVKIEDNTLRLYGLKKSNDKKDGLGGNLKYFKTSFVPAEPTDKNKIALTEKATEMLCVKEDTFEEIKSTKHYKIFRNKKRYTGIIFNHDVIDDFKKEIMKIDGKFSLYIFSLGDDTFDEEFEDMKKKVKLSPIPEAILRVYRRIFK